MQLKEWIDKRKSTRNYKMEMLDDEVLNRIVQFIKETKKFREDIQFKYEIITTNEVKTVMPWKAPHYIAIYSEEKENHLENIGFIFQQVDLYLHSLGLGTCWLGMGKSELKNQDSDMKFVILMAFGKPSGLNYRNKSDFKRLSLDKISDQMDERLEPARLAPSAVNSQPWYFIHDNQEIHAYRKIPGLIKQKTIGKMNQLDMGIALSHLYIANQDNFEFYKKDDPKELKGHVYLCSFKLND